MAHESATPGELLRLDAIARNLRLAVRYPDPRFTSRVVAACLAKVRPILGNARMQGEEVCQRLAESYGVKFEEVRSPADATILANRYLNQGELGFAQLPDEFRDSGVDALLFQRTQVAPGAGDRWVAVLNLIQTAARAYWNRYHELAHRIAEPPQMTLQFRRRHRSERNPVENLIDQIAAALAFYPPFFEPLVRAFGHGPLSFATIERIRSSYAPTASLLAVANAAVTHWSRPAIVLTAERRGRRGRPTVDVALRVSPQAKNDSASRRGLFLIPNMRVPESSPVYATLIDKTGIDALEPLRAWTTSDGGRLPDINVFTSTMLAGSSVYAVMSMEV